MTDEARAGEPRPDPVEQLADFILGKIESPEYQGLHPELASMGLAIAISERAAAAPALDVERLHPYLRHTATCALQAVRDNWPGDPDCTCGLRAEYARLSEKAP